MATSVQQIGIIFGLASERPAVARKGTLYYATDTTALSLSLGNAGWINDVVPSDAVLEVASLSTPAETGAGTTIASGVLTVTQTVVIPLPEAGTTDTVDSIVKSGVQAGDLLLLHVPATNTITVDDANINLAAATRAIAPGGSLLLVYDGTQWSEVAFTAATDNA